MRIDPRGKTAALAVAARWFDSRGWSWSASFRQLWLSGGSRLARVRRLLHGALVVHGEREDIGARAAAEIEPRRGPQARVAVEADVRQLRLDVRLRRIRMPRARLEALLDPRRVVVPREVPELELLPLPEGLPLDSRGATRPHGQLVHVEIQHVAALRVDRLEWLLHVEEEAGEILEEPGALV